MKKLIFALFLLASVQSAFAANTGGVFSPTVNAGHSSAQYRISFDPEESDGETGFAQRLHYQKAISGDFMWRVIGQTVKTSESNTDFDFVQAELFWQLKETTKHASGVRFDVRMRDSNRRDRA